MWFLIKGGLQSKAAGSFHFCTLPKGIEYSQSCLGYVLLTKLSFRILFSSASRAHPSPEGLWWTDYRCSVANIITRAVKNAKRADLWKCPRGL